MGPNAVKIDKRNYGIDLLRIVSMLYVVILHAIGNGGLGKASIVNPAQYMTCCFLRSWTFCAVDIFGIISGYVGYTDEEKLHNYTNYFVLWAQIVFYNVLIALLLQYWDADWVTPRVFIQMFFPVTNNLYWYFTAYTGLFFIMPLLNAGVRNCSNRNLTGILIAVFLLFSVFDSAANLLIPGLGYSFSWLMMLYLTGAILRKNNIGQNLRPAYAFLGLILYSLLSFSLYINVFEYKIFNIKINTSLLNSYKFLTYYLTAIFYVIGFSKLSFGPILKKGISLAAPGAFAVYLLNTHPLLWDHSMKDQFVYLAGSTPLKTLVYLLGFACLFVAGSICIDFFRQKLFAFFRIRTIIDFILMHIKSGIIRLT